MDQAAPKKTPSPTDEYQDRLRKLQDLQQQGMEAYPNDFRVGCSIGKFRQQFEGFSGDDLKGRERTIGAEFRLAGRILSKRFMGKAAFLNLRDYSNHIQIYVRKDQVGEETFETLKKVDLGDFLGVGGWPFRTKTDELTLECQDVRLLSKALRPLPEKWHGLQDIETRYRQRYLDLISNEQSRTIFQVRSQVIQAIREFFTQRQFLEVETPMMQPIPGGAAARPFRTHHNALDMQLYLRIAPELYLKRLVVGGFERVFEINRNFRNEGVSTQHNPEFTMLEFYEAYATYDDLMDLTEELIIQLVRLVTNGKEELTYQGQALSFSKPWKRMTLCQAIQHSLENHDDAEIQQCGSLDLEKESDLKLIIEKLGLSIEGRIGLEVGHLQAFIFEEMVEEHLIQPTFITQYPVAVSPLSRRNSENPNYVDRFELIVSGREIANAFSELNDPVDQRQRFESQIQQRNLGDEEAMYFDADYIRALEHGMPPTAGEGIGIDRLVMLLTDTASIREVILFPLLRPETDSKKK